MKAFVTKKLTYTFAATTCLTAAAIASAQTSSVLVRPLSTDTPETAADPWRSSIDPAAQLHGASWFTIPMPTPIQYRRHDLIQIIVREVSTARSDQSLDTKKEYELQGEVKAFPQLTVKDFLEGVLKATANNAPPKLDLTLENEFKGDGQYARKDDLSARVTAEVIEVLPNGNLVLEARTMVQTDQEISTIMLSGVCDPDHVSVLGTIQSSQLFNLRVIKMHEGDLRKATKKGLIPRVLDTIFAF